ncbi:MAG: hypothetical protein OEY79_03395 [Anaplasmataceae bacterium]|nr:hypothetical protein [Anaplasmataceae bacterium]
MTNVIGDHCQFALKKHFNIKNHKNREDLLLAIDRKIKEFIESDDNENHLVSSQSNQNNSQLTTYSNNYKNNDFINRVNDSLKRQNKQVEINNDDLRNASKIKTKSVISKDGNTITYEEHKNYEKDNFYYSESEYFYIKKK